MRSDTVTKGKQQAPHRSLFNALGMTQEEMDRPLVGIVSSYNEIVPGHGTYWNEVFSCNKRSDRRLYRGYGNGASVRCTCYGSELR